MPTSNTPNKFLGQHFLKDPTVAEKIVHAVDPQRGEVVLEIGPGHGELTAPLAAACKKNGAKLFAVEKDRELARTLGEDPKMEGVEIVTADALDFLKAETVVATKIVGNIPYYLTGHLLRIVSELRTKPERCVFMVQKEVAVRMSAQPPEMNRLAASVQFWAELKTIGSVPREKFDPSPKVDSVIVTLDTKSGDAVPDARHYYAAVRMLFAQPRKTVLNNLTAGEGRGNDAKKLALATLKEIGVDPGARPQDLTIRDIAAVARALWG